MKFLNAAFSEHHRWLLLETADILKWVAVDFPIIEKLKKNIWELLVQND